MRKLFRFSWFFRGGEVTGLFAAEEEKVRAAVGEMCYFGEILGKHSEVYGTLKTEDFRVVPCSPSFAEEFTTVVGSVGHNPLDCLVLSHLGKPDEQCPPDRMCELCYHGQSPGWAAGMRKR